MTLRPAPKPKRSKPIRKTFGKVEDRAYRDWIKGHDCLLATNDHINQVVAQVQSDISPRLFFRLEEVTPFICCARASRSTIEAAHVRTRGAGGADRGNLVPLCPMHHDEQEGDTQRFEQKYGIRLAVEAARLLLLYVEHIEK